MLNINEIKLAGRIGSDIEVKYLTNGDAVCSFNVAHNHSWKDSSGQWKQETTWLSVKTFRYLAQKVGKYAAKGAEVYVCGRFRSRTCQDRDGQDRIANEILAHDVQFPGSAKDTEQAQQTRPVSSGRNSYEDARAGRTPPAQGDGFEDMDDDVPF